MNTRHTARAVLLDGRERLLLFEFVVSKAFLAEGPERFWATPGGAIEPDEEAHEMRAHRWWTVAELLTTGETVFPRDFAPSSSQTQMPGLSMNQTRWSVVTRFGSDNRFSRTAKRISIRRAMSSRRARRMRLSLGAGCMI